VKKLVQMNMMVKPEIQAMIRKAVKGFGPLRR
jgi:hypothetical protein